MRRRPSVAELALPATVWVARGDAGFRVQALLADRLGYRTGSAFWGRVDPLGLILRNDLALDFTSPGAGRTSDVDARFVLAMLRDVGDASDRSWNAYADLYELDPTWDARRIWRTYRSAGLRSLRYREVELHADEHEARRSQEILDRAVENDKLRQPWAYDPNYEGDFGGAPWAHDPSGVLPPFPVTFLPDNAPGEPVAIFALRHTAGFDNTRLCLVDPFSPENPQPRADQTPVPVPVYVLQPGEDPERMRAEILAGTRAPALVLAIGSQQGQGTS